MKSLPIFRNRNERILICPAPDDEQVIVSLSEKKRETGMSDMTCQGRKLNIRILN